ncbi:hypothetical protein AQUCO_04200078v1 [Aquilegia coerulea]|uniref:FBD domain-containing protein n=1 Tax=Aquilegia coerulea TaxID=218851 RepID=A0A2G5CP50_AQUCA|nr:hypothetical protein AQUCO_04200078v1 [Aquilegia coerulea]
MPSLEIFILEDCNFMNQKILSISAPQLNTLKMDGNSLESIVIFAPKLVYFEIHSASPVSIMFDDNEKSIDDAIIDTRLASYKSFIQMINMLKHARYLNFSSCFLSSFFEELEKHGSILKNIQSPFHNLKWLKIETDFCTNGIIFINNLLKHSPQIGTVILVNILEQKKYSLPSVYQAGTNNVWFDYKVSRLKLVEMKGFRGSANEMKLVKHFLKNAKVIEKLIIMVAKFDEHSSKSNKEMMKLGRKLLTYPRASSTVGILFFQDM